MTKKQSPPEASLLVNRLEFNSIAFVVLFLSILVSILAWHFSQVVVESRARSHFELIAEDAADRIGQRLELYINVLYGAQGLFTANDHVNRTQWAAYLSKLNIKNRYPGFTALRFV